MTKKAKKKKKEKYIWGFDDVRMKAAILEKTLEAFSIRAKVVEVNALRYSVQYCIEIELGTTIESVLKREADLAMALSSRTGKIKIVAPLPNTNYIAIDLPKRTIASENNHTMKIVTANEKIVKVRNLASLVKKFPKKRLTELVDDALRFMHRNKFDVVGVILFQNELEIKPKEAIVVFKELINMGVVTNARTDEEKSGVVIGDVDWGNLKKYTIN